MSRIMSVFLEFACPIKPSLTYINLSEVTSCVIVVADAEKEEPGIDYVATLLLSGDRQILRLSEIEKDELVKLFAAGSVNLDGLNDDSETGIVPDPTRVSVDTSDFRADPELAPLPELT